jgi:hypothetical protein
MKYLFGVIKQITRRFVSNSKNYHPFVKKNLLPLANALCNSIFLGMIFLLLLTILNVIYIIVVLPITYLKKKQQNFPCRNAVKFKFYLFISCSRLQFGKLLFRWNYKWHNLKQTTDMTGFFFFGNFDVGLSQRLLCNISDYLLTLFCPQNSHSYSA